MRGEAGAVVLGCGYQCAPDFSFARNRAMLDGGKGSIQQERSPQPPSVAKRRTQIRNSDAEQRGAIAGKKLSAEADVYRDRVVAI